MNDNPHPRPLSADEVDELLSAGIDGEFDAAAAALGLTPAAAHAQLAEVSDVDDRRRALLAARDRLSTPDDLDEVVAARMRRTALAAADGARNDRDAASARRTRYRSISVAAGIAAVLIGVIALVSVLGANSSGTKSSTNAAIASPPTTVRRIDNVGFGTFADQAALAAKLAETPVGTWKSAPATGIFGAAADASVGAERHSNDASSVTGTTACASSASALVTGTATVAGRPVTVSIYARAGGHLVIVRDTACSVLARPEIP